MLINKFHVYTHTSTNNYNTFKAHLTITKNTSFFLLRGIPLEPVFAIAALPIPVRPATTSQKTPATVPTTTTTSPPTTTTPTRTPATAHPTTKARHPATTKSTEPVPPKTEAPEGR